MDDERLLDGDRVAFRNTKENRWGRERYGVVVDAVWPWERMNDPGPWTRVQWDDDPHRWWSTKRTSVVKTVYLRRVGRSDHL